MDSNFDNKKYIYKVFGLTVSSDFLLTELMPSEGHVDVEIINGKVPQSDYTLHESTTNGYAKKDELYFRIKGTGNYFVANGNKIIVEPDAGADALTVKLYLLGTSLGTILLQRRILPIHGSAIVIDGQCVIFTGLSGAGKSTLSFALREKGYPFLSDDVSAIKRGEDGTLWVQPGYPQQKICRDYLENTGGDISELSQINAERDKYAVPVRQGFYSSPVRLAAVCELVTKDSGEVSLQELAGPHKMAILMNHTYRAQLLHYFNLRTEHFNQCAEVSKRISVYRLSRPKSKFTVDEQIEQIIKALNKKKLLAV
ncbi:MAG: hypothetical protein N2484_03480 [Clostridia bacterium]|nr:hypothetical protein [Clostridia bacterium]